MSEVCKFQKTCEHAESFSPIIPDTDTKISGGAKLEFPVVEKGAGLSPDAVAIVCGAFLFVLGLILGGLV